MIKKILFIILPFYVFGQADIIVDSCEDPSCYFAYLEHNCPGVWTWDDPSQFSEIDADGNAYAVISGSYTGTCCEPCGINQCCTTVEWLVPTITPEPFYDCQYSLDGGTTWSQGCFEDVEVCAGDDLVFQAYNISLPGVYPTWNGLTGTVINIGATSTYTVDALTCDDGLTMVFDGGSTTCVKYALWNVTIGAGCCDCVPVASFNDDCDMVDISVTGESCELLFGAGGQIGYGAVNGSNPLETITAVGSYSYPVTCNPGDEYFVYGLPIGDAQCCDVETVTLACDDCQVDCLPMTLNSAGCIIVATIDCSNASYTWVSPSGVIHTTGINMNTFTADEDGVWTVTQNCGNGDCYEGTIVMSGCGTGGCTSTCSPTVSVSGCQISWTNCPAGWTCGINGDFNSPFIAPNNGTYTLVCNGPVACAQVSVDAIVTTCGGGCNCATLDPLQDLQRCFDNDPNVVINGANLINLNDCGSASGNWTLNGGLYTSSNTLNTDDYGTFCYNITCTSPGTCTSCSAQSCFTITSDCIANCNCTPSASYNNTTCEITIIEPCVDYTWSLLKWNTAACGGGGNTPILTGQNGSFVYDVTDDGFYQVVFSGSNGCNTFFSGCFAATGCGCDPSSCDPACFDCDDNCDFSMTNAFIFEKCAPGASGILTMQINVDIIYSCDFDNCCGPLFINNSLTFGTFYSNGSIIGTIPELSLGVGPLSCGSSGQGLIALGDITNIICNADAVSFTLSATNNCTTYTETTAIMPIPSTPSCGCPSPLIAPQPKSILPKEIKGSSYFKGSFIAPESKTYTFEISSYYRKDQFIINDWDSGCIRTQQGIDNNDPIVYSQYFKAGEVIDIEVIKCNPLENSHRVFIR